MSNKPYYKCQECGKICKHFEEWLYCCQDKLGVQENENTSYDRIY